MWHEEEVLNLGLTKDEALELFSRCLRSHEDDNEHFRSVLRKLARAIEAMPQAKSVKKIA